MIISDIISEVANQFGIHKRDIVGPSRFGFLMPARFALYKVLRERGMSLPAIGRWCGGRDHTTIRYGIFRAEYLMDKDESYRSFIDHMVTRQVVFVLPSLEYDDDPNTHHTH